MLQCAQINRDLSGNPRKLSNYVCAKRKIASYFRNRPENYPHKSQAGGRAGRG